MTAMNIKRAVAGSVVTLLLAVTSMAAACDLSCTFGFADSDCHAGGQPAPDSMASAIDMRGMDMPQMSMPGVGQEQASPVASRVSQTKAAHPSIGDMGPCERQSCGGSSFVATSAGRSNAAGVSSVPAIAQNLSVVVAAQILHGAREDISRPAPYPYQASPLSIILRI
jgi:hypothetical protein